MAKILRNENIKHILTQEEKNELGAQIAREVRNVQELEEEKKSIVSEYASKIALAKQNISKNSGLINNGYEFRSTECEIKMNNPKTGTKKIIPLNKIDKPFTAPMLPHEMQEELFDRNERKKKEAAEKAKTENGVHVSPQVNGDSPSEEDANPKEVSTKGKRSKKE
jgi:hypothetical protein